MSLQEKLFLYITGKIKADKEIKNFIKELKLWEQKLTK